MIRRLKYHQIDFAKYEECLANSAQYKYSANPEFLDITSNKNWELLVYRNYEAVMPVPFARKMGLKLVVNPKLCQQLGVFSQEDSPDLNDLFLDYLEKNYAVWYYTLNDGNHLITPLNQRKNYLINPQPYEQVRQGYSPKRKRKLRQEPEVVANSEIKEIDFSSAKDFIEQYFQAGEGEKVREYIVIFQKLHEAKRLKFQAFFYHQKIINLLALYHDDKTVVLLGTFNDKEKVKLSGASVLIDRQLEKNIASKIFDFEGGELPNVEEFFRGFRPEMKYYSILKSTKKEVLMKLVKLFLRGKSIF